MLTQNSRFRYRMVQVILTIPGMMTLGCATHPLGLNEEQWKILSPVQQAEYRARQTELDAENYRMGEAARLQRDQEQHERQQREQERLAAFYGRARYGDIITVTINGGMVAFRGKRFPFEPVAFDLVRGETKEVELVRQGESYTTTFVQMRLSDDGNIFYFDEPARKRFIAVNEGWDRGQEYHPPEIGSNDGHSEAIGIVIRIQYRQLFRTPQRHH